jgi:hypothetical protein
VSVTFRIIDYKALRRDYVRWRRDNSTIFAWYCNWFEFYKNFHHNRKLADV